MQRLLVGTKRNAYGVRLLVGTKRNAYGVQLQNSVPGTFFAATTYRTQPFLTRKIIQNQHYKIQCI